MKNFFYTREMPRRAKGIGPLKRYILINSPVTEYFYAEGLREGRGATLL